MPETKVFNTKLKGTRSKSEEKREGDDEDAGDEMARQLAETHLAPPQSSQATERMDLSGTGDADLELLRLEIGRLEKKHGRLDSMVSTQLHFTQLSEVRKQLVLGNIAAQEEWRRLGYAEKRGLAMDVLRAAKVETANVKDIQSKGSVMILTMDGSETAIASTRRLKDHFYSTGSRSFAKGAETAIMRLAKAAVQETRKVGWQEHGWETWQYLGRNPQDAMLLFNNSDEVVVASRMGSGAITLFAKGPWMQAARSAEGATSWSALPIEVTASEPSWVQDAVRDMREEDRRREAKGKGKGKGKNKGKGKGKKYGKHSEKGHAFPPVIADEAAASGIRRGDDVGARLRGLLNDAELMQALRTAMSGGGGG